MPPPLPDAEQPVRRTNNQKVGHQKLVTSKRASKRSKSHKSRWEIVSDYFPPSANLCPALRGKAQNQDEESWKDEENETGERRKKGRRERKTRRDETRRKTDKGIEKEERKEREGRGGRRRRKTTPHPRGGLGPF